MTSTVPAQWKAAYIRPASIVASPHSHADFRLISITPVLSRMQQQQPSNGRVSGTTRVGRYQKELSPTHTYPGQRTSLSPFSICNGPWHPLYSANVLDSLLEQPLSRSSLVFPLVLNPQLHTPCISSPNHHHLFTAHAHTNSACSAAISMLCHLHLVSLSAPYLGVYLLT